ncbi:MAG: MBL fold metallo-hydrolase [Deltaproteobacteria bacterium]|nr:MBL fold metallo-hydrolase [Deltaproteobacteria bacterium]
MSISEFPATASRLTIKVIVDNVVDIFLPNLGPATYPHPGKSSELLAEQGFAIWLEIEDQSGSKKKILYDFGRSGPVLENNLDIMGLDRNQIDCLVLSHGHLDHYGGMWSFLEKHSASAPLFVHPTTFGTRGITRPDGTLMLWTLERTKLEKKLTGNLIVSKEPVQIGPGLWKTGTIPRRSELDLPFKIAVRVEGQTMKPDLLEDDAALVAKVDGLGLIVMTGCCHAGVFNTLDAAKDLFRDEPLYALIGGLHLNNLSKGHLDKVTAELHKRNPQWLLPMHCTGSNVLHHFYHAFGERFITGTVGLSITFGR